MANFYNIFYFFMEKKFVVMSQALFIFPNLCTVYSGRLWLNKCLCSIFKNSFVYTLKLKMANTHKRILSYY